MRRLARTILVVCTAFAALVASSLQGRVLCYADQGRHFEVEAPHEATGCPDVHGDHGDSDHQQNHERCTDLAAEFSVSREAARSSIDVYPAALAFAPTVAVVSCDVVVAPSTSATVALADPSDPSGVDRLRTIILLV